MTDQRSNQNKRRLLMGLGILAIPVVALAWWLGSPLFLDTTVDETFPGAVTPDNNDSGALGDGPATPDVPALGTSEDEEAAAGPIQLFTGAFVDADAAHRGSGSATIFELEDGAHVLRFEDFEVTNGPDLHVLLVPTDDPVDRDLLADVGYEDLGKLKGNVGNQNYDLPEGFDPDGSWTVVIYCDPFHVVFSTARLSR